jgi:hypothetical protein
MDSDYPDVYRRVANRWVGPVSLYDKARGIKCHGIIDISSWSQIPKHNVYNSCKVSSLKINVLTAASTKMTIF